MSTTLQRSSNTLQSVGIFHWVFIFKEKVTITINYSKIACHWVPNCSLHITEAIFVAVLHQL